MTAEFAASVIVCTRNRAKYLNECLESLSRQDCRQPFEVIVVDNGSTDETPRVIQRWSHKLPHFRSVCESRIGLSAAKNAGAQSARGPLFLFTDDDVILNPQWVRSYLELFARVGQQNIIAGGPIVPVLDDLSSWPGWFDTAALPEAGLLDYHVERPLLSWEYVWGANMMIPAAVFGSIGAWNEELGRKGEHRGTFEDLEYQDRFRAEGGRVWFCPEAALRHRIERDRIRPRRLMSQAFARGRNDFLRDLLRSRGSIEHPPAERGLLLLLARLGFNLADWVTWSVVFRLVRKRRAFRAAHTAALSSGKLLERIRGGRENQSLIAWIASGVFFIRRVALGLTKELWNERPVTSVLQDRSFERKNSLRSRVREFTKLVGHKGTV